MTTPTDDPRYSGLLSVSGVDAKRFLQGQLTCDLEEVTPSETRLGAHCNPSGRIISLFRLSLFQDSYHLAMPKEMVPIAMAAFKKYAVFFKVTLTDASETLIKNKQETAPHFSHYTDIMAGIPMIYPETSEKFLPHDINLPLLNGVSFSKGCYTGQEIIARVQYRGKSKKHLSRIRFTTEKSLRRGENIEEGTLVDYVQTGYNTYELLIITQETN